MHRCLASLYDLFKKIGLLEDPLIVISPVLTDSIKVYQVRSFSKKDPENRKNLNESDPAKTHMKKDSVNPDFYEISFN
jgi:hypothetical protein